MAERPNSESTAPAQLTLETFSPFLGETFTVGEESGGAVELNLAEAASVNLGPQAPGSAFSLLFHGPADPLLPQATYHFQHGSLGAMEIFIVPLGRDEHSAVYEAVFG